MPKNIKAEIISIGTEILRGEITDTNAVYIASQLPLVGIELQRITTSGDDVKKLAQTFRQTIKRSSVVITRGKTPTRTLPGKFQSPPPKPPAARLAKPIRLRQPRRPSRRPSR